MFFQYKVAFVEMSRHIKSILLNNLSFILLDDIYFHFTDALMLFKTSQSSVISHKDY